MIHVQDNIYIDADKYQFILTEKKVAQESGNVRYDHLGYYPTLKTLCSAACEMKCSELIKRGGSLRAVQADLEQWADGFKSLLLPSVKAAVEAYEEQETPND